MREMTKSKGKKYRRNALGLVNLGNIEGNPGSPEHYIELKEKYRWFLSEEFTSVRKKYLCVL